MAVVGLTVGLIAGASGLAFAYFTSTGSGNGSAQTGTGSNVTISQVGAGYDSLISSNDYGQDQCFSCAGVSELGDNITLANSGAQQLTSVVVAVDNWGPAITGGPITLNIDNTVAGPVSFTQDFNVPAQIAADDPSTTDLTFNVASQGVFVEDQFTYGFTYGDIDGAPPTDPTGEGSLNIALSSSKTNLAVGTDTTPGDITLNDSEGAINEFPTCAAPLPTTGFEPVVVDCGPSNPGNPDAYGNGPISDDIPAVEFNVVGGTTPPLYPGGPSAPINFAITNPGSGNVHVGTVTTTATSVTSDGLVGPEVCATSMYPIANPTVGPIGIVAPGTTIFAATGTSISMTDDGNNQDNCEGAVVTLGFTSN
jgi:hypothetical protein